MDSWRARYRPSAGLTGCFFMGLHYVNWMSTCSGLEDENIHIEALNWLVGDSEITKSEQTTSYSGSKIHLISANVKNKGKATKSISRLGTDALNKILMELDSRLDEDNCIHVRLDLLALLGGKVVVTIPGRHQTVKGKFKLEVYPGKSPMEVATTTIETALNNI